MKNVTCTNEEKLITLRFEFLFSYHRYGCKFFWTASYIKQCISNLQWKLWWCEDYKSDSTSRYVTEAYSEQMNSVHIIIISFKEKYMANLYFIKHTRVNEIIWENSDYMCHDPGLWKHCLLENWRNTSTGDSIGWLFKN